MPSFPNTTSSFSVPERCERWVAKEAPRMARARVSDQGASLTIGGLAAWRRIILQAVQSAASVGAPLPSLVADTCSLCRVAERRIAAFFAAQSQSRPGRIQRIQCRGFLFSAVSSPLERIVTIQALPDPRLPPRRPLPQIVTTSPWKWKDSMLGSSSSIFLLHCRVVGLVTFPSSLFPIRSALRGFPWSLACKEFAHFVVSLFPSALTIPPRTSHHRRDAQGTTADSNSKHCTGLSGRSTPLPYPPLLLALTSISFRLVAWLSHSPSCARVSKDNKEGCCRCRRNRVARPPPPPGDKVLAGRAALWLLPLVSSLVGCSVSRIRRFQQHTSLTKGPLPPLHVVFPASYPKRVTTNTRSLRTSSRHYRTLLSLLGPTPNILSVASSTSTYIGRRASH